MKPQHAIDRIKTFAYAASDAFADGNRPDLDQSFGVLQNLVNLYDAGETVSNSEWGEFCYERATWDSNARNEIDKEIPVHPMDSAVIEVATRLALSRHYGNPHCIWCLEAM